MGLRTNGVVEGVLTVSVLFMPCVSAADPRSLDLRPTEARPPAAAVPA